MNVRFIDNQLLRRALLEIEADARHVTDHAPFPLVRRISTPGHDYEVDMGEKVLTRKTGQRWMVWRKT